MHHTVACAAVRPHQQQDVLARRNRSEPRSQTPAHSVTGLRSTSRITSPGASPHRPPGWLAAPATAAPFTCAGILHLLAHVLGQIVDAPVPACRAAAIRRRRCPQPGLPPLYSPTFTLSVSGLPSRRMPRLDFGSRRRLAHRHLQLAAIADVCVRSIRAARRRSSVPRGSQASQALPGSQSRPSHPAG